MELNKIYNMDCLEGMKQIADESVDLIIADPPYNIGKAAWDKIDGYVEWCRMWIFECQRILKHNGIFYWFHDKPEWIAQIMEMMRRDTEFKYLSFCVWDKGENWRAFGWKNRRPDSKTAPRSWFSTCEYFLHYVKGGTGANKTGLQQIYSNKKCFEPIKDWYASELVRLGITEKEIASKYTEVTGKKPHMLRHYFKDNQFALPSKAIYESVYVPMGFARQHANLQGRYDDLRRQYETLRYTHNCDAAHRNVFNVHTLGSADPERIHITQKPQEIIQRLIRVSSNPGDVVLDPFMGSGTTAVAALAEGRKFIGFETDEGYYKAATKRIELAVQ